MEFEADLVTLWNSRRRSALQTLAQLARDPNQTVVTRRLAKSILAKDDFILRLWNAGDEYIPLVYELLLSDGQAAVSTSSVVACYGMANPRLGTDQVLSDHVAPD